MRPSTLLRFHEALKRRKYRLLFSSRRKRTPGPKGPSPELIAAILELKQRNPRFGCPQIALVIRRTFGVEIDKDVVRRVLARHYRPEPGGCGPSWLTFIGHMKDTSSLLACPCSTVSASVKVHQIQRLGSSAPTARRAAWR